MEFIELQVTAVNFADLPMDDQIGRNDKSSFGNRKIEWDDYFAYREAVPSLIKRGKILASLSNLDFGLMKAFYCIKDGGRGDSDGYGVEPDTWVVAYLNAEMKFVSPFALEDSHINRTIANFLEAKIDPFYQDGSVKNCPFDKVERDFRMPEYFRILRGNDWGFANSRLEMIIPPAYKYAMGDLNNLVHIRMHNDLWGLLNLQNEVVIPAIYDYLTFIDRDEFGGCYRASLNGKTGILNQNNEIIKEFD